MLVRRKRVIQVRLHEHDEAVVKKLTPLHDKVLVGWRGIEFGAACHEWGRLGNPDNVELLALLTFDQPES